MRQDQHAFQNKRPSRSLNPSKPMAHKLCRECETTHIQQSRQLSVLYPRSSVHIRAIHSQPLLAQRHLHDLVQDNIPNFTQIHDPGAESAVKGRSNLKGSTRSSLKEKARQALDLFVRKDFGCAIQLCEELEASIRLENGKPSSLDSHITELELFRHCCAIEQWAAAEHSLGDTSRGLDRIVEYEAATRHVGPKVPLEAAFRSHHRISKLLLFEADSDPVITRAFELLGSHTAGSDPDGQITQSLVRLIDQSLALQLLPDRTSTLLQHSPRVHILDFLFAQREAERAMAWIWLWDKIDAVDWRQQVVTELQRASLHQRFADIGREDFILDVSRMLNKSYMPLTGIRRNLDGARGSKVAVRLFSPESVAGCFEIARQHRQPLSELLRIYQLDMDRFESKSFLYSNIQPETKMDLLSAWTEGVLAQRSLKSRVSRAMSGVEESPESLLWREMAMVGMLSSELTVEDVVRATGISRYDSVKTLRDSTGGGDESYQDSLVTFMESLPVTDARLQLSMAIRNVMSPVNSSISLDNTKDYRMLLQGVVHQVVTRLQHRGLISHALELKFRADCVHDEALLARVESAVVRWRTARVGRVVDRLRYQQHGQHTNNHHQHRSSVSTSPQIQSFLTNVIEPRLARMCAIAAIQSKKFGAPLVEKEVSASVSTSDFFSEWLTTMAEWSPRAGPMLRFLETPNKQLLPTTTAYRVALNSLLQEGELDMAAALHITVYDLTGAPVTQTDKKQHHFPSSEEVLYLVDHLTQDQSTPHVEQAQWIVDQHLRWEKRRQELSFRDRQPVRQHSSRILDTAIMSSLIRGWISRGDFVKVEEQVERMGKYELQPNKYFYSAFLKALVDLEPTIRNGRLVGSGDGQARQVGRRIAVQHMLQTRYIEGHSHELSSAASPLYVPSVLDKGWEILFQIIQHQEERHSGTLGRTDLSSSGGWSSADPSSFVSMDHRASGVRGGAEASLTGLDRMKSLVHQIVRATSHVDNYRQIRSDSNADEPTSSRFQPNIHIFSILLDAYSQRGSTDAILELLADMAKLGIESNEVVYTVLANAFAKRKNLRAMDQVIREAEQSGVDTGRYMYNIVLNTMVKMQASPEKIHEFLQRMARVDAKQENDDVGSTSTSATSRPAAAHAGDTGRLSNPFQGLDQVTLSTLMHYHVERRDVDSADQILRTMTSAGFVPEKSMYFLVLGARIQQHNTLEGLDLLRFMRASSRHKPDSRAWKGLLTCAIEEQIRRDREQARLRQRGQRSVSTPRGDSHRRQDQQQKPHLQLSGSSEERAGMESTVGTPFASKVSHSLSTPTPDSLVVQVLRDLWATVECLEAHDALQRLTDKGEPLSTSRQSGRSLQEQYVRDVFASSSWVTLGPAKTKELAAWMQGTSNDMPSCTVEMEESNEGKGRHGLLRRILDHLLRDVRRMPPVKQEVEQRCYEALWVVRQVEQHGLSLGGKWKWLVVGRRIEQLTGWSPQQIRGLLDKP
ncbi:hypothetical protein BGZ73_002220 [Actinomortierella ambigua]|nr:hypothetical protein BGZ73_002220 [Actinomortierella ambigua]